MHAFSRCECIVAGVSLSVDAGLGASSAFLNGTRNAITF